MMNGVEILRKSECLSLRLVVGIFVIMRIAKETDSMSEIHRNPVNNDVDARKGEMRSQ